MNPDHDYRKLRRGLKDVSPLFEEGQGLPGPAAVRLECGPKSLEMVSAFSPDHPKESLKLNAHFALKLAVADQTASIISVRSNPNAAFHGGVPLPSQARLKYLTLPWAQFETMLAGPVAWHQVGDFPPQIFFLDFDYSQLALMEKMIPVLDRWILLTRGTTESLCETYKMMKAARLFHSHLEYYLVLDGDFSHEKGSYLFERFAQLVAKNLGIHLIWLGALATAVNGGSQVPLVLDHLFLKPAENTCTPAKLALAHFLRSLSESPVGAS